MFVLQVFIFQVFIVHVFWPQVNTFPVEDTITKENQTELDVARETEKILV
jgi:hypothetical protein